MRLKRPLVYWKQQGGEIRRSIQWNNTTFMQSWGFCFYFGVYMKWMFIGSCPVWAAGEAASVWHFIFYVMRMGRRWALTRWVHHFASFYPWCTVFALLSHLKHTKPGFTLKWTRVGLFGFKSAFTSAQNEPGCKRERSEVCLKRAKTGVNTTLVYIRDVMMRDFGFSIVVGGTTTISRFSRWL